MNQPSEDLEHTLLSRGRYLRRPWKLFKPYLPRSDSLPDLSLIPHERPIFTCSNCNFSNTIVDLCLWCPPNLNNENKKREPGRRRRISAPAFLLCWQPIRPRPRSQILSPTTPPVSALNFSKSRLVRVPAIFADSDKEPANHRLLPLPRVEEDVVSDNVNAPELWDCETVTNVGCDVVTATSPSSATFSSASTSSRQRQFDESLDVTSNRFRSLASSSRAAGGQAKRDISYYSGGCVDRGLSSSMNQSGSSSSTKASCARVHAEVNHSSSSQVGGIQPTPTLRRKKSHIVLHLSAPPSQSNTATTTIPTSPIRQRPQSQPYLSSSSTTSQPLRMPITELKQHMLNRAQIQPELYQTHLGHPNRPYYTALRKDMVPPSPGSDFIPSAAAAPSRASSPTFYPPYPASFSDDSHELELSSAEFSSHLSHSSSTSAAAVPTSFTPFGLVIPGPFPPTDTAAVGKLSSPPFTNLGFQLKNLKLRRNSHSRNDSFSKSDEMKLRLALAREVGGGMDVRVDKGYVYQGGSMANVKLHLKRLSRGLKDLVMINTNGKRRS